MVCACHRIKLDAGTQLAGCVGVCCTAVNMTHAAPLLRHISPLFTTYYYYVAVL